MSGKGDDYLYIITDNGEFYRLSETEIKAGHKITASGVDKDVYATLTNMKEQGGILADIDDAPPTRSCICVALNLGYEGFQKSIATKRARFP